MKTPLLEEYPVTELPLTEKTQHACGCGCSDEGVPTLDVTGIPHAIRHATVPR